MAENADRAAHDPRAIAYLGELNLGASGDLGPGHQQRRAAPGLAGRRPGEPDRGAAALGGRAGALLPVRAAHVPAPRARRPGRGAHDRRPHGGARRGAARADRRHRRLRARAGGRGRRRRAPGRHPDRRHQGPARRPRHGARCRRASWPGRPPTRGPTRWCWRSPATATRRSCCPGCSQALPQAALLTGDGVLVGQPLLAAPGSEPAQLEAVAPQPPRGPEAAPSMRILDRIARHQGPGWPRRPPCGATSRSASRSTRSGQLSATAGPRTAPE